MACNYIIIRVNLLVDFTSTQNDIMMEKPADALLVQVRTDCVIDIVLWFTLTHRPDVVGCV